MNLLAFILAAYGLTQILVYSDMPLIAMLRPSKDALKGFGKVFQLPYVHGLSCWLVFNAAFAIHRTI